MPDLRPVQALDETTGQERIFWVAESKGMVIGTGDTMEEAAIAAHERLLACADIAARNGLPARYVRRLRNEADVFKVPRADTT